ncbi:putative Vacuolar protein sorting-associated protein 26C [Polypedilum vanderplanki]|uniref:Vacuolar protein sorting-associated protein 26 n=1 Tax=Polypedilum vanderplanki TaxID=319348 RepID=A0A9J6BSS4_POLVA|nr:putative Vacuolar protein sorting-associated protein 26C [Polypedilum vanderplanki]
MNFLGFGQTADIDVVFADSENRKYADCRMDENGKKEKLLLYYDGETISGKVNVTLKKPGTKLEHQGIKIELIGQIELFYDRGNHHEFLTQLKELARHGDLIKNTSYPFEFPNVEKPYEVYTGSNVRLRYFLRVTIVRRISDIVREIDIAVHTLSSYPEMNSPIKMEVGIEDCLHIEFEYNKSKYHLKDVIVGKIYFLLVRIKIKHMEIAIIKRETTGAGSNVFTENETIAKYEIMDGAPVKGESIPIRVFLAGYDLTPTMRDINKKFSVRYFLNLVLMDTEDRRYFKQQEITLWRKSEKTRKSLSNSAIGGTASTQGSTNNLTQAQQNATMPTHLVQGASSIHTSSDIQGSHTSPASSSNVVSASAAVDHPNMGLFTEEDSPQHEAQSKTRSNPLAFDTDEDKTPSKEEDDAPLSASKEQPQQQKSIDESSSLFDEPSATITEQQQSQSNNTAISNNDGEIETSAATADREASTAKD